MAGEATSDDFPTTPGAFDTSSNGNRDIFVSRIVDVDFREPFLRPIFTVSAASGSLWNAPDSIASIFSASPVLSTGVVAAPPGVLPLPTILENTKVVIIDSAAVERTAVLFFISPTQINFLLPEGLALGVATINIMVGDDIVARGGAVIESVSPALFTANADGAGVPAALVLVFPGDGTFAQDFVFDPGLPLGQRVPIPIDLGSAEVQVFVALFGTGMRGATGEVTATIGGQAVATVGPIALEGFVGLDQFNIGPLSRSLIGRGEVEIVVTIDGKVTNTVVVSIL